MAAPTNYPFPPFLLWTLAELLLEVDRLKAERQRVSGLIAHSGNGYSYQREGTESQLRSIDTRMQQLADALYYMDPTTYARQPRDRSTLDFRECR